MELRELRRPDAHGIGLEQQADAALAEEPDDFLDDFIEPRDRSQRLQRGAIRRMLPRYGSDLGENFARASRGQCGVSHLCRLQQWDSHTYAHDMRVFR